METGPISLGLEADARASSLRLERRPSLRLALDAASVVAAALAAYALRFRLAGSAEGFQVADAHLGVAAAVGLVLLAILRSKGAYGRERAPLGRELSNVAASIALATGFGVIISFLFLPLAISRAFLGIFTALLVVGMASWRWIAAKRDRHLAAMGLLRRNVLVVGAGDVGRRVGTILRDRKWDGTRLVGFLDDSKIIGESNVLGTVADFVDVARQYDIDEVLVTIPSAREKIVHLTEEARSIGCSVSVIPDSFDLIMGELELGTIGPFPVARFSRSSLSRSQRTAKRAEDLIAAPLLLFLAAPLWALSALAIVIESGRPVFFKQTRLGEGGREFALYKFRSMAADVDDSTHRSYVRQLIQHRSGTATQAVHKIQRDPRITRVGRVLRKYSLDELPQLWNVIKGDLSLVGPRPPLSYEYEAYEEFDKKRLIVRPGLTGLWQVSGRYSLDFEQMTMLDLTYIAEWSPWLDLEILLRTVVTVFRGTGL